MSEVRWGLYPLGGSVVRLRRQIPYAVAADILLTGRHVRAPEAKEIGLIGEVVPDGTALDRAREVAAQIAANGPVAVQAVLKALRATECLPEPEAMRIDSEIGMQVFMSDDAKEGPLGVHGEAHAEVHRSLTAAQGAHVTDTLDASQIDLLDRDRFTKGIPHEWFTWLRAQRARPPPRRARRPRLLGDHQARRRRSPATATPARSPPTSSRGGVVGLEEREISEMEQAQAAAATSCSSMDPPDHTRYRKLVNRGFTPRMIGAARGRTSASSPTASSTRRWPKGECDFVVDVAAELPLEVIAELIGVPHEDRHKIFEWSNRMIGSEDPEYTVVRRGGLQRAGRDVHVRPAARRGAPRRARATTSSPRC